MRPVTNRVRLIAGAAALMTILAACGGGEAENEAGGRGETSGEHMESTKTPQESPSESASLTPASSGDPFADARTAASHMPMTAQALATGIVQAANIRGNLESDAANLRASLTQLMQEHVYLAGIAVATAYTTGPDSPEFKTATETVDANSQDVAAAVGSVAGQDKEAAFLEAWRSHVNDFVAYAVAAKGGDEAGKRPAVDNLMAYAAQQGKFFSEITGGGLPAKAVQGEFESHITSLAAAIDALAADDTSAYAKLKEAAGHMPLAAKALAGGIVPAAGIAGDPDNAASELRANLTSMLNEHVYLAGISVFTAYTAGADSEAFKAAAAALDENSVALAKAVGSVAGAENEMTFLQVWRQHITDFVEYAVAAADDDEAGQRQQLTDLDAYRGNAGAFFEQITAGALPADAVAEELKTHIETLAGAIDSMRSALVK